MLEKFYKPTDRTERIKRLEEAKSKLKEKFIGLDDIIDQIILSITPWYVTPEVIERPVVVSLWGMTGTGKSSIVRELVKLLGLSGKSMFFDCGLENNNQSSSGISGKICDLLKTEDFEKDIDKFSQDLLFVLDEFQYARTLDESGCEVDKPNLRPIWSLLDNGILDMNDNNYDVGQLSNFVEDIQGLSKEFPDIKLDGLCVRDKEDVKKVLSILGYFYYDRGVPGVMKARGNRYTLMSVDSGDEMSEEEQLAPLSLLEDWLLRTLFRRLGIVDSQKYTPSAIMGTLNSCSTTGELCKVIQEYEQLLLVPRYLDCSKSLVFVIGNLDEAFHVEGDLNPDMDADVFYDQTSKVSISDIKNALKKRFRAEQIARFGNSIIKYPTLKREHFEKIIQKELSRICKEFEEISGKEVIISKDFSELLYSESVFPVQGVRPVFTTLGTIFSPLLSDMILQYPKSKSIAIGVKDAKSGYKMEKKTLTLHGDGGEVGEKEIKLELGELRSPNRAKTRFINGVHETGHAVMMAWCTGKLPDRIIGSAAEGGGFCVTYDSDRTGEIPTKEEIACDTMISLGGWVAERVVFGENPKLNLLGSGSDIDNAWYSFSQAVYETGYYHPWSFSNFETEDGGKIPGGFSDKEVSELMMKDFENFKSITRDVLEKNKKLIAHCALWIGEHGDMGKEKFEEFIEEYSDFGKPYLEERRQKLNTLENSEKILRGIL